MKFVLLILFPSLPSGPGGESADLPVHALPRVRQSQPGDTGADVQPTAPQDTRHHQQDDHQRGGQGEQIRLSSISLNICSREIFQVLI